MLSVCRISVFRESHTYVLLDDDPPLRIAILIKIFKSRNFKQIRTHVTFYENNS